MQRSEIEEKSEDIKEEKLPYFAEVPVSPVLVRLSGLLLFACLIIAAVVSGMFSLSEFTDIISDVKITIPSVIGCYIVRFGIQFIVLKFFTGLAKDQVRVGFSDRNLTPFVHSKRPFELRTFRFYLIMPFVLMFVVLFVISFIISSDAVYIISSIAAAFCINDLISYIRSLRFAGYLLAADHPEKFGFVLYDNPFHEI